MNTTAHMILSHSPARHEATEWKWLLFSGTAVAAFGSLMVGSVVGAIALVLVPAAIIALDKG